MPDTTRPLSRELAAWVVRARSEPLPPEVEHQARRVLLDYLAAALSGSRTATACLVRDYLAASEAPGRVQVLGTPLRLSGAQAALATGTAAHGLEVDDGYTPGAYHPGAPVISAALAAAEDHGASFDRLLVAIALGFEVSCRLAGAGHPTTWRRGLHNTPLAGVFGAAVAVTTMLEADERRTLDALGLAGSHAGGLFEFLGSGAEVKRLHAGKAARDGLVCAELAVRGLTGPATVLEGRNGYAAVFVDGRLDEAHLMDGLGVTWRMLRTYVKPYPCCRHLHGPIDAVLELADTHAFDPDAVRAIEVGTYPVAVGHGFHEVDDFLDAQMSIPYAVAVTVLHGPPALEHFDEASRSDPRVRALADKVVVTEAADCMRDYPAMRPARVRVVTDAGTFGTRVDQPWGEPDRPVDDAALVEKLHRLVDPVCGPATVDALAAIVWTGSGDATALLDMLAEAGAGEPVPA
ncbi:MAG: MmgE/PrpD family protein [Propionibacteriales bacterium]|nr:MmgE/PrpD family protein [Propionibacteriales bacterium]